MNSKEIRGIYNVTFNDKKSTPIKTDLEIIEDAVIDYVINYVKGYHSISRDRGYGAEHIKLHLEPNSKGQITLEELLNLGNSIREYLKIFKEPFIEENTQAKIFEWENNENVRFRAVVDKCENKPVRQLHRDLNSNKSRDYATSIADRIITFYSDRNLNQQMEFKNPKVTQYYIAQKSQDKAIERMKQKIDEISKRDFKSSSKDNSKDRGIGR